MRRALSPALLLALLPLLACDSAPRLTTAGLSLATLPSCPVRTEGRLLLRAAGDFSTRQLQVSAREPSSTQDFPIDTRWLSIEAPLETGSAGALVGMEGDDFERPALMLPLGLSCPLGDPLAATVAGAALAALPDGGLLVAGGRGEDGASIAGARLLLPGETLARQVEGSMLLRRAGAAASVVVDGRGARVLLSGGAQDGRGLAHDTYEVFDVETLRFDAARSARLSSARRDHGAAVLPGGRVLLAGGRQEMGGEALGSAELIGAAGGDGRATAGPMQVARLWPQLHVLDSGIVLVAGGRLDDGGEQLGTVERFDVEARRFEPVAELRAGFGQSARLQGDRLAWLGCPADAPCSLQLLLPDGDDFRVVEAIDGATAAAAGLEGLTDPRMVALRDGRLLVVARAGADAAAWLIDPARGSIESADASRTPEELVALADGSIAELDTFGASLRRMDASSAWHDGDRALLVDGPDRVQREGQRLRALVDDVRVDVADAVFGQVRVELELSGVARLLLQRPGAPALAVEVGEERVGFGECGVRREGNAVRVTRLGLSLRLSAGADERECEAPELQEAIGLAVVLMEGTRLDRLSADRL